MKKVLYVIICVICLFITACRQNVQFSIYFDSNGGSEVSSIKTDGKSSITIPNNPTKEGYDFGGWYWDNNTFNRPFTANSLLEEPISSNMTVYAKWISEAEYSITYVLNSGALSSGVNNTYKIEELPLTLPVPIRDGYEFDGWYTNENLEGSQVTSISLGEEDNKTYYAKWTLIEEEVLGIVTATGFEIDGTNMYIEVPNTTTTYSFIGQITVSSQATWDLYIDVLGIYRIATKTISPSIGDNTVYIVVTKDDEIKLYTVTVRRLPIPIYEVSFNTDGGSLLESQFIQEDDMLQEPTTIKSGYTLIGWEDDNNEVTFPIEIEEDMLIKAKWEANQNTLSFDSNGGAGEMGSVLVETNETTALPKNTFTRIGYTFVGWSTSEIGEVEYLDESSYTMGPQATYTLYAKWEKTSTEGLMFELKEDNTYEVIGYQGISTEIIIEHTYRGKTITSIGEDAFRDCSSLTSIIIPTSVTSIGTSAFRGCSGLTSITIPEGVTSIGAFAFAVCSRLTNITIPSSVTSIGDYAFYCCSSLTSIVIPTSVTSIGNWAFDGCSGLTSIIIPEGVTSIGDYAFSGCSSLTSITIPSSVTSIGDRAFKFCRGLTSITIPSSVTSIGDEAFYYCSSLTSITLPSSVTSIGNLAFQRCSSLTSITIPNSVTSIGDRIFSECTSLNSIIVASGNSVYRSENNCIIEIVSNSIILGCKSSIIPSSVTSIAYGAFSDCSSLTSITIPEGVTSIGAYAFYGCSGLTSITITEGVTSIEAYAFYGCSSLTSITIPTSVTSIGYRAFSSCSGLTSITIPSSVTSIGDYAFSGCSSLTIYAEASSKPAGWDSYWNSSNRPVVWGYTSE